MRSTFFIEILIIFCATKQIQSMNHEKDAILEKLLNDVKNLKNEIKILKDSAIQKNFVGEESEVIESKGNDGVSGVLNDVQTQSQSKESINKEHADPTCNCGGGEDRD